LWLTAIVLDVQVKQKDLSMKVGIVGCGLVGSTAAYAMVMRHTCSEIVMIDKNMERAEAEADDILHAVPFVDPVRVSVGDYTSLAGCSVVILTAGVNQQPGETRLQLLGRNTAVFRSIVPQVLDHAPDAILVVATNPVDIMTHLTAHIANDRGISSSHVVGSGTTLDTARFRTLLSEYLGIDSQHIHGYVVGEHGDSEVLAWSLTSVGSIPLSQFCEMRGTTFDNAVRSQIDEKVRRAAYHIISGKGATYYGIGSALAKIVEAILRDQRAILTVCTPMMEVAGVKDVTVSLPQLVGGTGILETLPLPLNPDEQAALNRSAGIIRGLIATLNI
jgi:L-lactate dehydrogenase